MLNNIFILLLVISFTSLAGCDQKINKPQIPLSTSIQVIEVSEGILDDPKNVFTISDYVKINNVISFLKSNLNEWYMPFTTYPTPQATAIFKNKEGEQLLVLWFGPNWVGGDDFILDSVNGGLSKSTESEIKELKQLLNIEGV